ncbi:MAG TPA: hypothetical protein VKT31_11700 [Solirubrobacteraceae bacterium]|nr:hypothetical protein [Solirubrobacteraceae bacterium]
MELISAIAEEREQALGPEGPREVGDEGAGRAVGPVHVLEHDDHRPAGAEQIEELEQGLEQADLCRRVVALGALHAVLEPGKERGELGAAT